MMPGLTRQSMESVGSVLIRRCGSAGGIGRQLLYTNRLTLRSRGTDPIGPKARVRGKKPARPPWEFNDANYERDGNDNTQDDTNDIPAIWRKPRPLHCSYSGALRCVTFHCPKIKLGHYQSVGLLAFTARFRSLHFSMDHRVKPGGDEEEGAPPQFCAQRRGPLTPPSPRTRGEGVASFALGGFDKASAGGEEQRNDRENP
jgi:hypothetical protein